jgi:hypothetical protein
MLLPISVTMFAAKLLMLESGFGNAVFTDELSCRKFVLVCSLQEVRIKTTHSKRIDNIVLRK